MGPRAGSGNLSLRGEKGSGLASWPGPLSLELKNEFGVGQAEGDPTCAGGEAVEQAEGHQLDMSAGADVGESVAALGHGEPRTQQRGVMGFTLGAAQTAGKAGDLEPEGHGCHGPDLDGHCIQLSASTSLVSD